LIISGLRQFLRIELILVCHLLATFLAKGARYRGSAPRQELEDAEHGEVK
jgi:hypothetical protein